MTFSGTLIEHIRLVKAMCCFDGSNRELVAEKLKFLYHACIASEQLLLDAQAATAVLPYSEFQSRLSTYYYTHWEEEKGEIVVLLNDLRSSGIDPGEPHKKVMAMIGTQYYLIKHVHPAALLGYMAVQEADPTSIEVVEILEKAHGINMFRFLRMHAIKDLEHRKELIEVIDAAPQELQPLITNSAKNALGYLNG